jgi:hypothetical protein
MADQPPYVIWSEEHLAWWGPGHHGYTRSLAKAGRYSKEAADHIVTNANQFLGPGKWHEIAIPDPFYEQSR